MWCSPIKWGAPHYRSRRFKVSSFYLLVFDLFFEPRDVEPLVEFVPTGFKGANFSVT